MKQKYILAILIALLASSLIASYETLLTNFNQKYTKLQTFEADLIQTNLYPALDMSLESSGKIYIEDKNVAIEYLQPMYQFIKLQGTTLTVYSQAENTVMISNESSTNITNILNLTNLANADFEFVSATAGLLTFKIPPPDPAIKDMTIYIKENQLLMEKISYSDHDDNNITIQLNNQKFNQTLSKQIADFNPPANASIIEN